MQSISLAIPFFNSSRYFLDCIQYADCDPLVCEIVVNDDCSSDREWTELNQIVVRLGLAKIKLFRNSVNVGAFRNKFLTVLNCCCDWVYLLDSDNFGFGSTYELIRSIPEDRPWVIYAPKLLHCGSDRNQPIQSLVEYEFGREIFGMADAGQMLRERRPWFQWFVNTGNYLVHRSAYLDALKMPYIIRSTPMLEADTAAAFFFALEHGMQFRIMPGPSHFHRLRSDSDWHCSGQGSQRSVDHYSHRIIAAAGLS